MSASAIGTGMLTRGADGWRGLIGHTFSPDLVASLASATGRELLARHPAGGPIVVAHDGRAESGPAARRAAGVLAALGFNVRFVGPLPTPVATHAVRRDRLLAAFLVTASHNPAAWNGVKLKVAPGMPPPPALEVAIERRREAGEPVPSFDGAYREVDAADLCRQLVEEILSRFNSAVSGARFRVVVDGLHGVAGRLLAQTLGVAGCDVTLLGGDPDPEFGGLVPDPMRPESRVRVARAVRAAGATLGFVLDGDGDRLGVIDDRGAFVWSHDVLALLAQYASRDAGPGAIATTVSTGASLRRSAAALGREVLETPIGFKHMAPLLCSGDAFMGGGGVGDAGFRMHGFDRDPNLAALMLLQSLAESGRSLADARHELAGVFGRLAYAETSIPWRSDAACGDLESFRQTVVRRLGWGALQRVERRDGIKLFLDDDVWLLLRAGSTEPVLRLYAEARSDEQVAAIIRTVTESAGRDT